MSFPSMSLAAMSRCYGWSRIWSAWKVMGPRVWVCARTTSSTTARLYAPRGTQHNTIPPRMNRCGGEKATNIFTDIPRWARMAVTITSGHRPPPLAECWKLASWSGATITRGAVPLSLGECDGLGRPASWSWVTALDHRNLAVVVERTLCVYHLAGVAGWCCRCASKERQGHPRDDLCRG